jgi:hypothetical protein
MASRQFLPTQHPVVDPKTGIITQPWLELFKSAVAAVEAGAGSTIWSTLNGVTDWRTLASLLTSAIVGNALPAGVIRQVVIGTHATEAASSSSTYANTGLTATITPSSALSRILVVALQAGCGKSGGDTSLGLKLRRGTTDLAVFEAGGGYTASAAANYFGACGTVYLDSPASAAAVTYSTQFASLLNIAQVIVQANSAQSAIALLEVQG